jgi:hypothetical protein
MENNQTPDGKTITAAETKKLEKEAKKAEREAKKQAKAEEKIKAKLEKEANKQPKQNGVRRPYPGSLCEKVWQHADQLSQKLGQAVPIGELLIVCKAEGFSVSTIRTQYAHWKKFHGLSGRIVLAEKA